MADEQAAYPKEGGCPVEAPVAMTRRPDSMIPAACPARISILL